MTSPTSAPPAGGARTATIGDQPIHLERPNGVKVSRALAELRQAGGAVKAVTEAYGTFVADYERTNVLELDRVQARLRYAPRPILTPDGEAVLEPDTLPDGSPNPRAGEPVLAPSVIDRMTEADWDAAGGVLRLPRSPGMAEIIGAVLPIALEVAEDRVWRLMALFAMSNADVARYRKDGTLDERLTERADELLCDAYGDELLELAVACGELVDHHFRRKVGELGDRLGNALRLVGLGPKTPTPASPTPTTPTPDVPSETSPSSSRPTSSSGPAEPGSDGTPTPSSASPSTSSPPSSSEPTPSAPSSPPPDNRP